MSSIYEKLTDSLARGEIPNLSLLTLPGLLGLAALPHWWSIAKVEKTRLHGGWNNCNPRSWVAQLNARAVTGGKLTALEEKLLRAQSCQQNAFEWWPMWAVAIILGNLIGKSTMDLNVSSGVFFASRILYTHWYVNVGTTRKSSFVRTGIFNFGVLIMLRYYFAALFHYM